MGSDTWPCYTIPVICISAIIILAIIGDVICTCYKHKYGRKK